MAGMYRMKDLIGLLVREGGEELCLVPDTPPAIVAGGKPRAVDTLSLSLDELEVLLNSISSDKQYEELQKCGDVRFTFIQNSTRFAVAATRSRGTLRVSIRNLDH